MGAVAASSGTGDERGERISDVKGSLARGLLLVASLSAVAFSAVEYKQFLSGSLLSDFRGFYCASRLAAAGLDPYRQEPLYSCERTPSTAALWHATGNVTDPVPLPPYAVAVFIPIGKLPFQAAAICWTLLLVAAWAAVVLVLRAMTRYPWIALVCAVLFGAMMSISLGQIAPLAIAAICVSALLLKQNRPAEAGAVAAIAMLEPHVALPSYIALFIAVPRSRPALALAAAVLAALSLLFGIDRNAEYLLRVLPAHALSDVPDVGQYSATVLASAAGLSDDAAIKLGTLFYIAMACTGIAVACRVARNDRSAPLVPMLPMAFAVFGGTYVHWQQVVGAVPVTLLLMQSHRVPLRLMAAALVSLAVPWLYVVAWGFLIPAAIVVIGTLTWQLARPRTLVGLVVVVGMFAVLLSLNHALPHAVGQSSFNAVSRPADLADFSWGAYVRARIPIEHGLFFWLHFPTWMALAFVLTTAVRRFWSGEPSTTLVQNY